MTYERFEDLPVWRAALDFATRVFELVEDRAFNGKGDVRGQLQRSSFSILQNISEGFERGTTPELLTFLYIARGSAGESRSGLRFCHEVPWLVHRREEVKDLINRAIAISRQLRGWADSLQNCDIPGQRYLNDATRNEYQQRRRSIDFWEKLQQIRDRANKPPESEI